MNRTVHSSKKSANLPKPAVQPRAVSVASKKSTTKGRTNDPVRTMAEILEVATQEFAQKGLAGARIDEIAERTRTSKRMIYYYFESKEGLYVRVLEEAYQRVRAIEAELHLGDLAPEQALRRLVEFTFDHHAGNEDYIRLVMGENINRAQFLMQSKSIQSLNVPALEAITRLYERGVQQGIFRKGLTALDIHATISALSFFNVGNRHTFGTIFKYDPSAKTAHAKRRTQVVETVVRFVQL
ncbi:MAG: TetR/AcrR family transcriptional regulator [Brachymonas sp.]